MGATICDCDYYEHGRYDLASLVLKVSVISECNYCDVKLAHEPLKELDVFNSCEYILKVATHLIDICRINSSVCTMMSLME